MQRLSKRVTTLHRSRTVGVTTGPCSGAELLDEGADVVFPDLTEFPAWLRENADRLSAASTVSPAPR